MIRDGKDSIGSVEDVESSCSSTGTVLCESKLQWLWQEEKKENHPTLGYLLCPVWQPL